MVIGEPAALRRIGAITLVVLALAIAFVALVLPRIEWHATIRVHITLRETAGLREGAPLVVAGRPVGSVETIALTRDGVVITVALPASAAARIPRGGDVFVASKGPFSSRYLELGAAPNSTHGTLADGDRITGINPPSLDRVLQRTWDNLTTARAFADTVKPELAALRTALTNLATTFDTLDPTSTLDLKLQLLAFVAEARALYTSTLGGADGLTRLRSVLTRGRTVLSTVKARIADLRTTASTLTNDVDAARTRFGERTTAALAKIEATIATIEQTIDQIDPILATVADIRGRIERGEGSLGRIMTDPEFPEDAKELGKIMKRQPWRIIQKPAP